MENCRDYRLIRVGLNGKENNWFGQSLEPFAAEPRHQEGTGEKRKRVFILDWLLGRREERKEQKRLERERLAQQRCYEERLEALEGELKELAASILAGTEEWDDCACIYMDGMRPMLCGDGVLAGLWKKSWNVREFVDYKEFRWASLLLPYAAHFNYVFLGTAPCIRQIAEACARNMKSLRWILREKELTEEVQEFVEDFYDEYGLAVILQTVAGRNGYRTLCLEAIKPVCVLDFTEETKLFWGGLADESVWLDFASLEEKERRVERLAPGIAYLSLKKLWCRKQSLAKEPIGKRQEGEGRR